MNFETWQKIKAIFNEAVDLAPEEREALLDSQNGVDSEILSEVRKLLAAERKNNFENPVAEVGHLWRDAETEDLIGKQIGDYRLKREIGRGGMGVVFEAAREKDDFAQTVALKLLKRGMDSETMLRRFRHERQILASLEHANIARLLDGGTTTDGLPFFVMEYVEGLPLDEYCDAENLGLTERLRLFLQICAAVSFAHSRLVVHRDLKPTNILVSAGGAVKLLDFGIAKILSQGGDSPEATVTALGMMTPDYASPEQIKGELVSTASDIYSLGLILYELLTGVRAYQFPSRRADEMAKIICEREPLRPSAALSARFKVQDSGFGRRATEFKDRNRESENATRDSGQCTSKVEPQTNPKSKIRNPKSLRGDLDNIILKALRKEPARRYASVEQFSEDLRRHLEGLPVKARPDTFSYRFEKFVSRNRVPVAAAVLIFLTLIGGIVATGWQAHRAELQRAAAEKRFNQVRELANNVVFKYYDEAEKLPNSTVIREMFVKDSLAYFDSLASDENADDALKSELARAFLRIGRVQGRASSPNLGDTAGALENYRKGIELLEPLAARSDALPLKSDLIAAYVDFSNLHKQRGDAREAEKFLRKSISLNEDLLRANAEDSNLSLRLATNYLFLGDSLPIGERENENIAAYQRASIFSEAVLEKDANNLRGNNLAVVAAERIAVNLLILAKAAEEDADHALASELRRKAQPLFERNLETSRRLVELYPREILPVALLDAVTVSYGTFLFETGNYEAALEYLRKAEKNYRQRAADDTVSVGQKLELADVELKLGAAFSRLGQISAAEPLYRHAFQLLDELVAHDAQNFDFLKIRAEAKFNYGDELKQRGEIEKARLVYEKAFAEIEAAAHEKDFAYGESLRAWYLEKLGDCDLETTKKGNLSPAQLLAGEKNALSFYRKAHDLWLKYKVLNIYGVEQNNKLEILKRKINDLQKS